MNQQAADVLAIDARPATVRGQSATGTVLVVEDEEALRLAVSKMLQMKSFTVIEAIDGSAGVNLFRANQREIVLVLLDMTLPAIDGPQVFAELQRIRSDVKVILTTHTVRKPH
jgi:DNA-binding response OmpR family regulator